MADNVLPSTDPNVATDDVSGVHYQKMKLVDGTADSTTAIPGSINGLYVQGSVAHDAVYAGNHVPIGGIYKSSAPTAVADGDAVRAWFTRNGALKVHLVGETGNTAVDDAGNAGILVQGNTLNNTSAVTTAMRTAGLANATAPTPQSAGAGAATWVDLNGATMVNGRDVRDAAIAANTNPIPIGGRASAAAPADMSADGDSVMAWFLRNGAQATVLTAAGALIGGDATNGLDVDVTRLPYDVAHDGVDSGNPIKIGGKASSATPTAVAAGDRVDAWFGTTGGLATFLTTGAGGGVLGTAAPTDAFATVQSLGTRGHMMLYNGATWDMVRGDITNGLDVDVTRLPALAAGTNNIGDVDVLTVPAPLSTSGGGTEATALRVTVATDSTGVLSVDDNGASLTVDATGAAAHDAAASGAPVLMGGYAKAAAPADVSADADAVNAWYLRNGAQATVLTAAGALIGGDATNGLDVDVTRLPALAAGTNNIGDVDVLTLPGVAGDVAHDAADSGNPVKVGAKAANALPTPVANNDRTNNIADLWGRQLTSHIDPAMAIHKSFNATTTQTGIDVWSPTSGKKIAVTSVVIGTYGTTAARVILWFGDNADTVYTAGTDQLLLAASFAPSATSRPGLVFTPAFPVFCTTADRELHITTDAGISIDVAVEGYEW